MLITAVLALLVAQAGPPEITFYETPDAVFEATDPQNAGYYSLTLSRDGKLVAAGSVKEVVVWDTGTKKEITTIREGSSAIAFSPKADLLATGARTGIKLTDTKSWKLKDTLKYNDGLYRLAFSPDGTVLLS